jgi:hypothetical protein
LYDKHCRHHSAPVQSAARFAEQISISNAQTVEIPMVVAIL